MARLSPRMYVRRIGISVAVRLVGALAIFVLASLTTGELPWLAVGIFVVTGGFVTWLLVTDPSSSRGLPGSRSGRPTRKRSQCD
jgi:fatty acid desaturase